MAKAKSDKPDDGAGDDTPTPPAPKMPPAARVCDPNDRAAGTGLTRFKLRAKVEGASTKYVLAPDRAAAEACYRAAEPAAVEGVTLVVTELPD